MDVIISHGIYVWNSQLKRKEERKLQKKANIVGYLYFESKLLAQSVWGMGEWKIHPRALGAGQTTLLCPQLTSYWFGFLASVWTQVHTPSWIFEDKLVKWR